MSVGSPLADAGATGEGPATRRLPHAQDPVAFIRDLAPRIRKLAPEIERNGQVHAEITDALRDGGIFSLMAPVEVGGGAAGVEAHPSVIIDTIEELTVADASAGWATMAQMASVGTLLALLPDEGVRAVVESDDFRMAGQIPMTGKAVPADGGFTVSGRFSFASGSPSSGWFIGGFVVQTAEGEPIIDQDGQKQMMLALVPRSGTELLGGWDVLGLVGTASVDYSFTDQFVPEHLTSRGRVLRGSTLHHANVRLLTSIGHSSVSLGIMRASLEAFRALAQEKFRPPNGLLVSHETVQATYADWHAKVESARAWVHRAFTSIFDTVKAGGTATGAQEADCRLAATHVAFLAAQITQSVYLLSGSDGLRNGPDNLIQRTFRDAHTASQHMLTAQHVYIEAGRIYLDTPGMQETHRRILDHVFAPPLLR
jgi:alkylation response protein AidB-like acyl-CoA dehydrogenase